MATTPREITESILRCDKETQFMHNFASTILGSEWVIGLLIWADTRHICAFSSASLISRWCYMLTMYVLVLALSLSPVYMCNMIFNHAIDALISQANLCYMEGMWTEANGGKIDEPFTSDRHAIAAKSFFDLTVNIVSYFTYAVNDLHVLCRQNSLPTDT